MSQKRARTERKEARESNPDNEYLARLDDAFSFEDDGTEAFDMDAVIPSQRRWKLDGRWYTIPASPPPELLLLFTQYEEEQSDDEGTTGEQQFRRMMQVENAIHDFLVSAGNEDVPEKLNLGVQRLPMAVQYIIAGRSAIEVTLRLLRGGQLAEVEEALEQITSAATEAGAIDAEPDDSESAPPLASPKPSPRRSSRSGKSTGGRRTGGAKKASPSPPSSSTSPTPAATT